MQQAWQQTLQRNGTALDTLVQQAQALGAGFAALPVDANSQAAPVPAVAWQSPAQTPTETRTQA